MLDSESKKVLVTVLEKQSKHTLVNILVICVSVIVSLSTVLSIIYYNKWKTEKMHDRFIMNKTFEMVTQTNNALNYHILENRIQQDNINSKFDVYIETQNGEQKRLFREIDKMTNQRIIDQQKMMDQMNKRDSISSLLKPLTPIMPNLKMDTLLTQIMPWQTLNSH
jgi:hypothetical protein